MEVLFRNSGYFPQTIQVLLRKSLVSLAQIGSFPILFPIDSLLYQDSQNKMGSMCSQPAKPQERTVTFLPNNLPEDNKYKAVEAQSIRLCDITAYKKESNLYEFSMSVRDENEDIKELVPVLNEMVHCLGSQNYELQIQNRMVIDIFDKKIDSVLMDAKNLRTSRQFSIKLMPFSGYSTAKYKRILHELHITKQLSKSHVTLKLMDYFVYGLNADQQVFVFLFDKTYTSLANVAEYRKLANTPWLLKQKLKVIYQIFQSYESLHVRNIIHRDLRPSNVFYVPSMGKFAIGNFSKSRKIRSQTPSDLMSVCGVPEFSCDEMQRLMKEGEHIGYYDGIKQDYTGLKSILNILETCEIFDRNPSFEDKQIDDLSRMLNAQTPFRNIMNYLKQVVDKHSINRESQIGDRQIADSCSFLLAHTHKALIQNYVFQAFGYLGYHKNYSDKAHKMMALNNENAKQVENAPILARLGDFYEQNGAKGTEYFYNAFVLYILRADNQIRYGYPDRAENELQLAQEIYFKFNRVLESQLPRIQIKRVSALIELAHGNAQNAKNTINQNLVVAAKANIPVEKQCKILLAYGKIYGHLPNMQDEAIKKLVTGLTICQNGAIFESPSSCRVMKSRFLRELGILYAEKLRIHIFMKKNNASLQGEQDIRAQAETQLRSALQIQERQTVDDLEVADTSEELGLFYYYERNFYDARRYLEAAKIRLAHMKEFVNPKRQLAVLYTLGSCTYYLQEYYEAKMNYMTCLGILEKLPRTEEHQIYTYNIEGNLGLTLLRMGNPAGQPKVDTSLTQLKHIKGEKSFDYASLYNNYLALMQS